MEIKVYSGLNPSKAIREFSLVSFSSARSTFCYSRASLTYFRFFSLLNPLTFQVTALNSIQVLFSRILSRPT